MRKHIGIFIEIAFEVWIIKRFLWWWELFAEALTKRYWTDIVVCLIVILFSLVLGAYNTGRLLEDIKKELR